MATVSQKTWRIEWNSQENYSSTVFHGYTCQVVTSAGGELIMVWNQHNELVYDVSVKKSRRQAEIRAEVQLKSLVPRSVLSKFNPPERRASDVE